LKDTFFERVAVFCDQELKELADRSAGCGFYVFFAAPDDITNQPKVGDVNLLVHCFSVRISVITTEAQQARCHTSKY
jgi:hypothetical protein